MPDQPVPQLRTLAREYVDQAGHFPVFNTPSDLSAGQAILHAGPADQVQALLEAARLYVENSRQLGRRAMTATDVPLYRRFSAVQALIGALIRKRLQWSEEGLLELIQQIAQSCDFFLWEFMLTGLFRAVEDHLVEKGMSMALAA